MRTVATIKQIDYRSKEEFEKDVIYRKRNGYILIENDMFNHALDHGAIIGCDTWKYTAYYVKTLQM